MDPSEPIVLQFVVQITFLKQATCKKIPS